MNCKPGTLLARGGLLLALALLAAPAAAQTGYSVQSDATGSNGDHLFKIDLATGVATDLGDSGFDDVESLAFSPGCAVLYAVDDVSDRLLTCDIAKGSCKAVGGLGVDVTDTGLAFGEDGILYMSTDAPKNPARLYKLNTQTGKATAVGSQGQEVTGLAGTAGSAACRSGLYGLGGDGRNNLVCLDIQTGQAKVVGALKNVSLNDGGLDFDPNGQLLGLADANNTATKVIRIDRKTGQATVLATVKVRGQNAGGFEGLAIERGACAANDRLLAHTPTLDTAGLLLLGMALAAGGLFALRRR